MINATTTKETEVKRNARENFIAKLANWLENDPEYKDKFSRVENGISVAVDDVEMSTGEIGEICIVCKPTVPDYVDKIDSYGEVKSAYERLKEEDKYIENIMKKEEKAEKARREKEERTRKLQAAKAERLRQKLAALEMPNIQPPAMENLYPNLR